MVNLKAFKQNLTENNIDFSENEPMKKHTTFKIGGMADAFVRPDTVESLKLVITCAKENDVPFYIIGGGSNVLFSDYGYHGAVISTGGLSEVENISPVEIKCGAGVKLSRLCSYALEKSLTGIEFAWGIPGTAGGAAFMNAGAYGGEMKNIITSCSHITPDGEEGELSLAQMHLGYRTSAYAKNGFIITSVNIALSLGETSEIRALMDDLIMRRKSKQPVELPSAGSTFKRPTGNFAGTLIEQCGLKGRSVGGAQVSEKHAGFIINNGDATAKDVSELIEIIQNEVYEQTGVELECEVRIVK